MSALSGIEHIRARLRAHGAKPCHEEHVLRLWAQALPEDSGHRRPEDFLPLGVRTALPALLAELQSLARLRSEHAGEDGSARLLVELADGQTVESALLPRDGVCVSTQAGCAVGCVFCMTGRDGLARQLVGVGDRRAPLPEQLEDGGLPRGGVAGEGDPKHGSRDPRYSNAPWPSSFRGTWWQCRQRASYDSFAPIMMTGSL